MANEDFENAKKAYEYHWNEAKKYGDLFLEALEMRELIDSKETRDIFQRQANRFFEVSENYRKSAELAVKVLEEMVRSGII